MACYPILLDERGQSNHQIFDILQNILLKSMTEMERLASLDPSLFISIDFGDHLNRQWIISLAFLLKVKGIKDHKDMDLLISYIHRFKTSLSFSPKSIQLFPEPIRSIFLNQTPMPLNMNEEKKAEIRSLVNKNKQELIHYYTNIDNQSKFQIICWLLLNENRMAAIPIEDILKSIKPLMFMKGNYMFIDYIIHEEIIHSSPGMIDTTIHKISKMIWDYHLLRMDYVLYALLDKIHIKESILLLEKLITDESIRVRKNEWVLHNNTVHWLQNQNGIVDDYRKKFPKPKWRSHLDKFPSYFTNDIEMTLTPLLDYMIWRFIEEEMSELLVQTIDLFMDMYNYHPSPMTFIHNTLFYYYDSNLFRKNPMIKQKITQILCGMLRYS